MATATTYRLADGRQLEDRDGLLCAPPPVGSRVARGDLRADRRSHP
jgi:hypothetical protein